MMNQINGWTTTGSPRSARSTLAAILAAMLLGAAGCSSGGSSGTSAAPPAADPGAAAAAQAPIGPLPKLGYRLDWRGFPQVGGAGMFSMDIAGDTVIVQDRRNVVTVMEDSSGANRWAVKLGNDLTKFVGNARLDGQLLCCAESEIQVLDIRTGAIEERQRLSVLANTPPVVVQTMAIFGGASGEMFGHNLRSGFKQWGYSMSGRIVAHPVIVDDTDVAVFSNTGEGVIVSGLNGQGFGRRPLLYGELNNNPVAGGGMVFAASRDQSVWAFSGDTGSLVWRHRTDRPLRDQPTYHDGRLYQTIPGQGLVAFRADNGEIIWTSSGMQGSVIGVRTGTPSRLLVWNDGEAILLDADRGDVVDRVELPDVKFIRTQPFVDGNVYTATKKGVVEKYSPRN